LWEVVTMALHMACPLARHNRCKCSICEISFGKSCSSVASSVMLR